MIVRCWGSRGSIPVSGAEFTKYGGDTTCIEIIGKDGDTIIVDAGTGIRRLGNALSAEGRQNINLIFTHAHWDHLSGFPFFKPAYNQSVMLNLYGCPFAQESIKNLLSRSMSPPHFPVKLEDLKAKISYLGACNREFDIGSIHIVPILLSHPNQGIGYKFIEDGRSFVFLTDNELAYKHPGGLDVEKYRDFSTRADLLVHDAEYTRQEYGMTKGWGHSVFEDAVKLALDAHVKRFGMFHHNQDRTDSAVDHIVDECKNIAGPDADEMECFAVGVGTEVVV